MPPYKDKDFFNITTYSAPGQWIKMQKWRLNQLKRLI
jgi:hypothetical protein